MSNGFRKMLFFAGSLYLVLLSSCTEDRAGIIGPQFQTSAATLVPSLSINGVSSGVMNVPSDRIRISDINKVNKSLSCPKAKYYVTISKLSITSPDNWWKYTGPAVSEWLDCTQGAKLYSNLESFDLLAFAKRKGMVLEPGILSGENRDERGRLATGRRTHVRGQAIPERQRAVHRHREHHPYR